MALACSLGVSTASTANAGSYASGSFTPTLNSLLIVFVTASGCNSDGSLSDTGQSAKWTRVATPLYATNGNEIYCFVANQLAAAAASTVTFACADDNATGAIIQVVEVTGMTIVGPAAIRQIAFQQNVASGTPAPVFPNVCLTGNAVLTLVGNSTSPAGTTVPSGFTSLNNTGFATPTTGAVLAHQDSGFTSATVTWGGASASAFGSLAIELDSGAVPDSGVVQQKIIISTAAVTSQPITLDQAVTIGNTIVVLTNDTNGVINSITGLTDSLGNTYTRQTSATENSFCDLEIWTAPVTHAGTPVITATLASNDVGLGVLEYAGTVSVATDKAASAAAITGTTMASGTSGTLTQAQEVIVALGVSNGTVATRANANAGYHHNIQAGSAFTQLVISMADQVVNATTAVNAGMTLSASGHWAMGVVTLKISSGSPKTFTQSAVARIQNSLTKTQSAKARIQVVLNKTQSATARIANLFTKTQSAVARIAQSLTKTQSATARIQKTVTKTQPAIARIQQALNKTQSAVARIGQTGTKTQAAIARIANTLTKTQSATARIQKTVTKTQSAVARIQNSLSKTQTAIGRIANSFTKTQSAVARIAKNLTKTQSAVARIQQALTKTQSAKARIANSLNKTQGAVARLANTLNKTQSAVARIQQALSKTQSAKARIQANLTKTQSATAKIVQTLISTFTQSAKARIANSRTLTQPATARIIQTPNFTPIRGGVLSSTDKSSMVDSSSKLANVAGGAKLEGISSTTKNQGINSTDEDSSIASGSTKGTL